MPIVTKTINSKKFVRAQALLGIYVHFCSYFPPIKKWLFKDTIFE